MFRYLLLLGHLPRKEHKEQKECWLLKLPYELRFQIFTYLSLFSQACFTLSCKSLLAGFGTVPQHPDLAFPLIKRHGRNGVAHFVPNPRAWTELLLRLRGGRGQWWKYCGDCLKLHMKAETL